MQLFSVDALQKEINKIQGKKHKLSVLFFLNQLSIEQILDVQLSKWIRFEPKFGRRKLSTSYGFAVNIFMCQITFSIELRIRHCFIFFQALDKTPERKKQYAT